MPMERRARRLILIAAAMTIFLVPVAAIAGAGFTDVEGDSVFVADIQWMKDNGITLGCNPPTNDRFCPGSDVTREQMAAFMHRLAANQVVDAATVEGMSAADLVGQTGPTGPAGPAGPSGVTDVYRVSEYFTIAPNSTLHGFVQCNTGDVTTGGGYDLIDDWPSHGIVDSEREIEVFSNGPYIESGVPDVVWYVGIRNMSDTKTRHGYLRVVCIDLTP